VSRDLKQFEIKRREVMKKYTIATLLFKRRRMT
jgi:hypothetical protein